jgi:hypothetical protein
LRSHAFQRKQSRDRWDTLINAEIANANIAPDVLDAFVEQLRNSLENYKCVYEDAQRFLRHQAKRKRNT